MTDINEEDREELATPQELVAEAASSAKVPFSTPNKLARAKELVRTLAVARSACHTSSAYGAQMAR